MTVDEAAAAITVALKKVLNKPEVSVQLARTAGTAPITGEYLVGPDGTIDPNNKKVPPDAQFIVPRHAQAFKWYTGHGDVADWKDLPQSAEEIVRWWQYMQDIYATDLPGGPRWFEQPADMGAERLRALARKYGVQYVITKVAPPRNCYDYYSMQKWLRTSSLPGFDVLYRNNNYAVLRIVLE